MHIPNKTDRKALLEQITALDFMATDLHLYLNTHPDDAQALEMQNQMVSKCSALRAQYEEHHGPLTGFRSGDATAWRWIEEPWPWQRDFNFSLRGE